LLLSHPNDAFHSPTDPPRTALILNANLSAAAPEFHPDAVYRLNIDNDGDCVTDIAVSYVFTPQQNGRSSRTSARRTRSGRSHLTPLSVSRPAHAATAAASGRPAQPVLLAIHYRQALPSRQAVANHKRLQSHQRKEPPVLRQVAEGVLIHESEFCQSNAVVVHGRAGVLLIDPGVLGDEMACLANDLSDSGQTVVAGFSTHPHWDHLLGHASLGAAPRYGTARCAATVRDRLSDPRAKARIAEQLIPPDIADQVPLDLLGLITGLPAETAQIPWDGPQVRIVEHHAHAPGHAALLIEERGVLVAGDMLSDVLIPMLDLNDTADPIEDYLAALRLLEGAAGDVDVILPGHGSVGRADQVRARIDHDRAYVHALRDAQAPSDPRVGPSATPGWEWVGDVHARQLQGLARRS
jgi:glyoxylase-like metal-dependent hydrolase (beta-lactamase superfamily II)